MCVHIVATAGLTDTHTYTHRPYGIRTRYCYANHIRTRVLRYRKKIFSFNGERFAFGACPILKWQQWKKLLRQADPPWKKTHKTRTDTHIQNIQSEWRRTTDKNKCIRAYFRVPYGTSLLVLLTSCRWLWVIWIQWACLVCTHSFSLRGYQSLCLFRWEANNENSRSSNGLDVIGVKPVFALSV